MGSLIPGQRQKNMERVNGYPFHCKALMHGKLNMNNQKTLLVSLLVTATAIGLVETDVIQFNHQSINAQIDKTKAASIKFFGTPTQTSFNNLVLKNNINGDVVVVQPNALMMINNQDIKFQFKAYNPNENSIVVTRVKTPYLQLEYKLSEIDIMKLNTYQDKPRKKKSGLGNLAKLCGGACLGGIIAVSTGPSPFQELGFNCSTNPRFFENVGAGILIGTALAYGIDKNLSLIHI